MYIKFALLLQSESLVHTGKVFQKAVRIGEKARRVDPTLLNNLGVVSHLESWLGETWSMYENALVDMSVLRAGAEAMSTVELYNLAQVYKD
jgi:RNA polymerase-associated protein CTR9